MIHTSASPMAARGAAVVIHDPCLPLQALGARSSGARADFSFRLTFTADSKAGVCVWEEEM
jgi:hypothetical protein